MKALWHGKLPVMIALAFVWSGCTPADAPAKSAEGTQAAAKAAGHEAEAGLRKMALGLTPEEAGIAIPANGHGTWGAVMDLGVGAATATLVSLLDGTTSLYYSTGGGIIGAGEGSKDVSEASKKLVATAESCVPQMKARGIQGLPKADHVRFYVHTRDGLLSSDEIAEEDLQTMQHPLSPCYAAAQDVLTRLRLAFPPK